MSVQERYQQELGARGYHADAAQLAAVAVLQRNAQEWAAYKNTRSNALKKLIHHPPVPQGVYLYGGVGRGKSFLMDLFYTEVALRRKVRLHFHEFMREVHAQLNVLKGQVNPLMVLGRAIASKHKLICFDEFHVANIADAMILQRLLQALFDNAVGLVMTSNFAPDSLYPNGLHRDRILPAIALLKNHMQVLSVDAGIDYRRQTLCAQPLYFCPIDTTTETGMQAIWQKIKGPRNASTCLRIEGRNVRALRRAGDAVWFDFRTLCGTARSQNDYLRLSECFQTIVLSGVPQMHADMAQAARRFTWLVDVLYDRRVKLIVQAQVPVEKLYTQGPLAHEFVRTASRLFEMQGSEYLGTARRQVDSLLTSA